VCSATDPAPHADAPRFGQQTVHVLAEPFGLQMAVCVDHNTRSILAMGRALIDILKN
jgi:hypothetical protein